VAVVVRRLEKKTQRGRGRDVGLGMIDQSRVDGREIKTRLVAAAETRTRSAAPSLGD
jgi:hypothetical protein